MTLQTKEQKLTQALPWPWAEMGKPGQRKEPIRLLNSLPCPLGKNKRYLNTYVTSYVKSLFLIYIKTMNKYSGGQQESVNWPY